MLQNIFRDNYPVSAALIGYLDKQTCKNGIFTVAIFMTLKMTLKPRIDNDIHPHLFCHPMVIDSAWMSVINKR